MAGVSQRGHPGRVQNISTRGTFISRSISLGVFGKINRAGPATDVRFISQKPFTLATLLDQIEEVLEGFKNTGDDVYLRGKAR